MKVNMKAGANERKVSRLLKTLGQPVRLQILMAIGEGEACVCHLEATLGLRQAYLSQHLMALRKAKILQTRREGRYIFYRLGDQKILDLIRLAGEAAGTGRPIQPVLLEESLAVNCICPACAAPV
jgi:ArsR family transcriptional regulator